MTTQITDSILAIPLAILFLSEDILDHFLTQKESWKLSEFLPFSAHEWQSQNLLVISTAPLQHLQAHQTQPNSPVFLSTQCANWCQPKKASLLPGHWEHSITIASKLTWEGESFTCGSSMVQILPTLSTAIWEMLDNRPFTTCHVNCCTGWSPVLTSCNVLRPCENGPTIPTLINPFKENFPKKAMTDALIWFSSSLILSLVK